MKAITLTEVIREECKDPIFSEHFERETLINDIAKMIIQLREQAKLTQKELAERAHTTQPVVARIESGADRRVPSLELLTRLALGAHARLKLSIDR